MPNVTLPSSGATQEPDRELGANAPLRDPGLSLDVEASPAGAAVRVTIEDLPASAEELVDRFTCHVSALSEDPGPHDRGRWRENAGTVWSRPRAAPLPILIFH